MSDSAARRFLHSPVVWPMVGLLLLVVANCLHSPAFLSLRMLDGHLYGLPIDILIEGARTMVLALGMTLVIATGGVDLSVGSVMAISGAVAATVLGTGSGSVTLAVLAALGVGVLAGAINGVLVAYAGIQPIIATLILMYAGRGVAQVVAGGEVLLFNSPAFSFLGKGYLLALPFGALLAFALYIVVNLFLRKTAAGLFVEAIGDNPVASRFAGLSTARVKALAYVGSGVCAAIAGVMYAANISAADSFRAGENMELDAIFAVVVGGTALTGGRFVLLGSLIGALLLQTLTTTMYSIGVAPAVATVPKAMLILAVCLLQSDRTRRWLKGLFVWRAKS